MAHPTTVQPRKRFSTALAPFQVPAFRLLFANNSLASVAMNVRTLVHGWLVFELSGQSPFWLGISAFLVGMGQLLFSAFGGSLVDRFQRRNVLFAEQVASAAVIWTLAVTTYLGVATLGLALFFSFAIGCTRAVSFTATNYLLYDTVGPERLLGGAALFRMATSPMVIFGSLLAGKLIASAGISSAYAFMGVVMVVALTFLVPMRVKGTAGRSGKSLLHEAVTGLAYAAKAPQLRTLFTISVVMESLGFSFVTMLPAVAETVLHAGPTGLGLLSASTGVGSLLALIGIAMLGNFRRKSLLILVNAAGAGAALIAFSLSRSLPLSMLFAMFVMGFLMAYDLTLGALIQLIAPPSMRGRMVSMHSLAIAFTSLGGFATGALGSIVGVPVMMTAGGIGIIVNALLRRPGLLRIEEKGNVQR